MSGCDFDFCEPEPCQVMWTITSVAVGQITCCHHGTRLVTQPFSFLFFFAYIRGGTGMEREENRAKDGTGP